MQYRTRGTKGVGEPLGAESSVPRTNSGDFILEMCSLNSDFHGAGGRADAEGAVVDMVRRNRERRRDAVREAMVAIVREQLIDCDALEAVKSCEASDYLMLSKNDVVINQICTCQIVQIQ